VQSVSLDAQKSESKVSSTDLLGATSSEPTSEKVDADLIQRMDKLSLEEVVDLKISRFLDQIGQFYPDNLHSLIMSKVEKPLLSQILQRVGRNQVHASKILGINRNTLRKKIRMYNL
jgi:DNA-binding protein Fis